MPPDSQMNRSKSGAYDKGILIMRKFLISLMISSAFLTPVWAADDILRSDHPDHYIVQQGDTLWSVASMFLTDAWLWPDIWELNPTIENPHLIYPGDELSLTYKEGQPRLNLKRGPAGRTVRMSPGMSAKNPANETTKLEPRIREIRLASSIPAIPLDSISSMLTKGRIVNPEVLASAPYVLAGQTDRLIFGAGDSFYARGNWDDQTKIYGIYRKGNTYVDPNTKEFLGFEAIELGLAQVLKTDADMSTLTIISVREDVRIGDRLLPTEETRVDSTFYPSSPEQQVNGIIMNVIGGVTQVGKNDVVVINRGEDVGLRSGNVLAIYRSGKLIKDRYSQEGFRDQVRLPSERAGLLMVFRVFDKMSYALILRTQEVLRVDDEVRNP